MNPKVRPTRSTLHTRQCSCLLWLFLLAKRTQQTRGCDVWRCTVVQVMVLVSSPEIMLKIQKPSQTNNLWFILAVPSLLPQIAQLQLSSFTASLCQNTLSSETVTANSSYLIGHVVGKEPSTGTITCWVCNSVAESRV